jgi:4-hydroxy-4-methyl-2-oxoglutarate aldolase
LGGDVTDHAQRLARCYSGAVYDTLRERGIDNTVLPRDIRPLDDTLIMAGPVFTVRGSPKTGISGHDTLLAWTGFLSRAPKGHVVVCQGQDDNRALMGELSAETLQSRGVLGYLSDGGCRDSTFIRSIGFPVFSRFFSPRDVVGTWTPDAFDEPIVIGGVSISSGDYIIADIDGAVIIPGALVDAVITEVEAMMQTESKVRNAIRSGVDPQQAYLQHGKF